MPARMACVGVLGSNELCGSARLEFLAFMQEVDGGTVDNRLFADWLEDHNYSAIAECLRQSGAWHAHVTSKLGAPAYLYHSFGGDFVFFRTRAASTVRGEP